MKGGVVYGNRVMMYRDRRDKEGENKQGKAIEISSCIKINNDGLTMR